MISLRMGTVACAAALVSTAAADDWPTWGGTPARNMACHADRLPVAFDPGEERSGKVPRPPSANVKWIARLGSETYGNPTVCNGKVFVGTNNGQPRDPKHKGDLGVVMCFRESDGEFLWQLVVPKLKTQGNFIGDFKGLGVCSSPAAEGGRVYVVTSRCDVLCLDANGLANGNDGPVKDEGKLLAVPKEETIAEGPDGMFVSRIPGQPFELGPTDADVIWRYDMMVELKVWPQDASNCNILIDGDYLYVCTSNGVDRSHRRVPSPKAPSLIVLDKRTGKLVAVDDAGIGPRIYHGQWSSPAMGVVNGRKLIFFGGGDGFCYAFDARPAVPPRGKVGTLKTVWKFDCNPPEHKLRDGKAIPYQTKHMPRGGEGPSEIIATPVFHEGCLYVAVGQDPRHGMGPGCLSCIDASGRGDVTERNKVWQCREMDRSLSTVSIADDLVYAADYTGLVRCLEAHTGKVLWVHDTRDRIWGSTFVGDGKVYVGTQRGIIHVLAAGRQLTELGRIKLDTSVFTTPICANGTLYVTSMTQLLAVRGEEER